MEELKPPKPKANLGRKRGEPQGTRNYSTAVKAKISAQRTIREQNKKIIKAQNEFHNAKKKKENILKTDGALKGKDSAVLTTDTVETLASTIQEHIKENIVFEPNKGPQTNFLAASEREVFYGGARGGGKSYAMLVDPLRYCDKQHHRALLLRRSMPELRDMINHSQRLYSRAYPGTKWREQEKEWRFPSGARIEFGYAENLTDVLRYQGQSYTWIGVDELPQYPTPEIYNFLRSSLRSVDPEIPVFMRATGNPGNIGSGWVKDMFIDPSEPDKPFDVIVDTMVGEKKITRRFIPAKLYDNPYLTQTDDYLIMLSSLPEVQRKQFLEGDWNAFENSAFPEFDPLKHVTEPFEIPRNWHRFRTCDWGYSSPACCLWIAIDFDNNLWVYREFYTRRMTADIFAKKILEIEINEYVRYGVLDSSTWARRGDVGPSIAETMIKEGCRWRPSDRSPRSRINGKLELHKRFSISERTEEPSLKIFNTCRNLLRTLPLLPVDKNNPEDVDTNVEDHAYDALRYGAMSRPIHPKAYNNNESFIQIQKEKQFKPADRIFGY
jgi:hypothetical protein